MANKNNGLKNWRKVMKKNLEEVDILKMLTIGIFTLKLKINQILIKQLLKKYKFWGKANMHK